MSPGPLPGAPGHAGRGGPGPPGAVRSLPRRAPGRPRGPAWPAERHPLLEGRLPAAAAARRIAAAAPMPRSTLSREAGHTSWRSPARAPPDTSGHSRPAWPGRLQQVDPHRIRQRDEQDQDVRHLLAHLLPVRRLRQEALHLLRALPLEMLQEFRRLQHDGDGKVLGLWNCPTPAHPGIAAPPGRDLPCSLPSPHYSRIEPRTCGLKGNPHGW